MSTVFVKDFRVCSAYIRPGDEDIDCSFVRPLTENGPAILAGNVNAHHPKWDALLHDDRGDQMLQAMETIGLLVYNDPDTATRPNPAVAAHRPTSPDVTAARGCE
eukprot:PhM_4_TR409/c4_g1_i1/m.75999